MKEGREEGRTKSVLHWRCRTRIRKSENSGAPRVGLLMGKRDEVDYFTLKPVILMTSSVPYPSTCGMLVSSECWIET